MYVDTAKTKRGNKTYIRNLLRTSYREDGKVKHKTVLNLSICSQEEIAAIKVALKYKGNLTALSSLKNVKTILGKSIGAVWTMKLIAERTQVLKALGNTQEAKLALLQVIVRVIDQGSRLSAVRFAKRHAVCEILGIKKLNEDDLYENLAWLARKQEDIEKKLFKNRFPGKTPTLFLYDVTSSYLEGNQNEFADWGYNRGKKKEKKQIVVGLLTGPDGLPVAVRVFAGNTVDTKTVAEQVRILARNFDVKDVTLVGDRGMLKGPQVAALPDDFRYVTAISKPQIRKKLNDKIFQYELFTEKISEVRELEKAITNMNITVQEAINELEAIRMEEVKLGDATIQNIPIPTETGREILNNTSLTLPKVLPEIKANVHTKKKLQTERKRK